MDVKRIYNGVLNMNNKEIGGRGISSTEQDYRQILLEGTSNSVKDGDYTITYSDDGNNYGQEYTQPYCAIGLVTDKCWQTNTTPFPHWWQVDLGRIISGVFRFSFNPVDDVLNVLVKNYECQYSLDGINFKTLKSGLYIPKSTVISNTWQAEVAEFNLTDLRYFRIVFKDSYSTRGYTWNGFRNALLYAYNSKLLYLKKSDNNIYGILPSSDKVTILTSLSEWNSFTKEKKEELINRCSYTFLGLSDLKSLNDFQIINKIN